MPLPVTLEVSKGYGGALGPGAGGLCAENEVPVVKPTWEHSRPETGIPLEGNLVFVQKTQGPHGLSHFSNKKTISRGSILIC